MTDPYKLQEPTGEPPTDSDLYFELTIPIELDGSLDLSDMTLEELLAQAKVYAAEIKRKRLAS